jgi:hypothetical protein
LGKKYAERRLRSTREGKRKGEERPTRTPLPDPSRQCPPGWAAIADGVAWGRRHPVGNETGIGTDGWPGSGLHAWIKRNAD